MYLSESEVPQVSGWCPVQVETLYESIHAGPRYEQRTVIDSGQTPVLNQTAEGYLGYHDNEPGTLASLEQPIVTFANHTCEMRLMKRPFSAIQNVFPMRGREAVCRSDFLYYATKGRVQFVEYKGHHPQFRKMWIALPSLNEQRAIAEVLGALDDKIAANERVIDTLSAIDDAEFASALREPVAVQRLDEIAKIAKGVSYRSADLTESSIAMVTLKCVTRNGEFATSGLKEYAGDFRGDHIVKTDDIVIAQTDLTQAAEVIGRAVRVPKVSNYSSLVASLDLLAVRSKSDIPNGYLLGALRRLSFRRHCQERMSGTTVLHLGRGAAESYEMPTLESREMERLSHESMKRYQLMDSLQNESVVLASTRDSLLPLLMSGKIRVKDAEKAVEEVT